MRLLQATCAPTTRELCNRTRRVIVRYSNEFLLDVGVSLKTWAVRPCFCVRPRAITSMVTCCWLMVAGWEDDGVFELQFVEGTNHVHTLGISDNEPSKMAAECSPGRKPGDRRRKGSMSPRRGRQ